MGRASDAGVRTGRGDEVSGIASGVLPVWPPDIASVSPDRVVGDKTMAEHLRFGVCYWHSFNWPGSDVFGAGTFDRPWLDGSMAPMDAARLKMDAAFEFFSKLGTPFWCFHDLDIAPEGTTFAETQQNVKTMVAYAEEKMAVLQESLGKIQALK